MPPQGGIGQNTAPRMTHAPTAIEQYAPASHHSKTGAAPEHPKPPIASGVPGAEPRRGQRRCAEGAAALPGERWSNEPRRDHEKERQRNPEAKPGQNRASRGMGLRGPGPGAPLCINPAAEGRQAYAASTGRDMFLPALCFRWRYAFAGCMFLRGCAFAGGMLHASAGLMFGAWAIGPAARGRGGGLGHWGAYG